MSNLRRPTNVNGPNSSPLAGIKPQTGATDRYCVKCKTWKPSKGGRQMPGTKLWICAAEHGKPKPISVQSMPSMEDA